MNLTKDYLTKDLKKQVRKYLNSLGWQGKKTFRPFGVEEFQPYCFEPFESDFRGNFFDVVDVSESGFPFIYFRGKWLEKTQFKRQFVEKLWSA